MPSAEADRGDRAYRERAVDRALAEDRAGKSRLRDAADTPPPEPTHLDTPNRRREARP